MSKMKVAKGSNKVVNPRKSANTDHHAGDGEDGGRRGAGGAYKGLGCIKRLET